jgi:hypothetical protein
LPGFVHGCPALSTVEEHSGEGAFLGWKKPAILGILGYTWQPIYPIFGVRNRLQPETGLKPVATDFPIAVAHH